MKIEVLMSTINRTNIDELRLAEKNIDTDILIINQTSSKLTNEVSTQSKIFIRMLNYEEKGTSTSKNRAIDNATGEICILADDDIIYVPDYKNVVEDAFKRNHMADVITFQSLTPEGKRRKKYKKNGFLHNRISLLKVSMIEIAFRRESILQKGIRFNEEFGINHTFRNGEEIVFIRDCIKNGLRVIYEPLPLVIHPKESSGTAYDETGIRARGAIFANVIGKYLSIPSGAVFITLKYLQGHCKQSLPRSIMYFLKGRWDYISKHRYL